MNIVSIINIVIPFVLGTAYGFYICERLMNQYKESAQKWAGRYYESVNTYRNTMDRLITIFTKEIEKK